MVYFVGKIFREFRVLEKIIHRKQKIYMVHTLFLTDLRNFNPAKYTTYTVLIQNYNVWAIKFKLYDCVTWCTVQVSDAASV